MRIPSTIALAALLTLMFSTDTSAAVGRTKGQFAVSQTGSAQYTIPIWAPPGPRSIQPNISLFYDSRSPIGSLGIGWSIAGLGQITRCNKTVAQDTTATPVALVTTDGYCINGNRLRLTSASDTYGAAGSTYQTEIADFSNITANGTAGNGPASFTVQGRNGLTYYYGYTDSNGNGANSQVLANGTTTAITWLLSKVIDRAGNNYVINYTTLSGSLVGTAVPYKIYWTPTSAGGSNYTYTMEFNYTANVPQSSPNKYVGGTQVSNTQLLSSIEVLSGTAVVRDYFLGYGPSPTTSRKELTSITECPNTTESSANCLLPSTVTYAGPTKGVSGTVNTALSSSGTKLTARYDLNGDGIPDLIYNDGTNWYVSFGSASGYGAPINTGISASATVLPGNLNAGIEDSLLANNGSTWYYYTWNGASFEGVSTGLAYDSTASQYQLADINGDGRPDLICLYLTGSDSSYTASVDTRLNTTSGSTVSFSSTLTVGYSSGVVGAFLLTPDAQLGKLRHYDFNGDGLDDLVIVITTNLPQGGGTVSKTYELLTSGTTFNPALIADGAVDETGILFTNWNDDKCTDLVVNDVVYVSGCNGSVPTTVTLSGTVVAAMDWDGDGRTDLVVDNGTDLGVYLSTGGTTPTLITTSIPYSSSCQYMTMDATGGGTDDLGCWSQSSSKPITYYLHYGIPDLVTEFQDGYGNSVSPTYSSIAQNSYTQYSDATYPYQNYIGPLYVVSEAVFSDPSSAIGGTYNFTYWYYGAWMNLEGRGFQAFYAVETFDHRTGLQRYQYYERAFPYTGMEYEDAVWNGSLFTTKTTNTLAPLVTLDAAANNERYFPYFGSSVMNQWELGGTENGDLITTKSTNFTLDNYGNATTVATTVADNDPGSPYSGETWTSTTVNTISPNTSTWCLGLPTETQVTNSSTAAGGTAITRTVNYTADYTNCRETQKVTAPGTAYQVTEAYGFDAFGNINSDAVTGTGMAARTTSINWGTTGQFPTTITNPLGQVVTLTHDPNSGRLTSQTDPNSTTANPIVTTWAYDGFGRKTQETRPDGTYTQWSYVDCADQGGCLVGAHGLAWNHTVYNTNNTIETAGTIEFDTVDRPLMEDELMLSGSSNRNERRYDNLGNVKQVALPCLYTTTPATCTSWITNTHDILNRLTQSQRPISSTNSTLQTTAYAYAGRTTTVTDALNNTTTKISLVTGNLGRSKDAKGYYQNFTYDAFGSLSSVTDSASPANTLFSAKYQYGIGSFQTSSTDLDLGARAYTVDPLGEVTGYTDAKSQSFSMTYDLLSRPLVRTEPDLTTVWTWGNAAASYNIGKLQAVTAASAAGTYSDTYTYDNRTRLSSELISNPGDRTYNYIWSYNSTTGLLSSLQYPVDISFILTLQYAYSNGILQSISSNSYSPTEVFWTADATNARGQLTQETLGNGVVINRNFDAVTGWLGSVQAGVGGGATLQNNTYAYDYDGDVTQRQDNNQGLTENFYYDALNRLDHSTLNGNLNLQMTYDLVGMGNIASRSDVAGGAAWTYDPVHVHQVTQAGSASNAYVYDANGNVTSRNGFGITWSSYNYPTGVNAAGESVTFQYGPNRQRWQEIYTGPNGTETTNRAGKLFEVAYYGGVAHYRHYIYAGNELVAVDDRTTQVAPLYYIVGDHQGSIANIENGANPGTNFVSESFTAYGMRRSGETWSGPVSAADEASIDGVTRRGYTGQSVLGVAMYLNHMNGRIEDAITGRFLSPDPYVQDPGNTQNFNRYSYVNNNPLTYTDPSGFVGCPNAPGGTCGGGNNPHGGGVALPFGGGGGYGLGGDDSGDDDDGDDAAGDTTALTDWYNGITNGIDSAVNAGNTPVGTMTDGAPTTGGTTAQSQNSLDPITVTAQSTLDMGPSADGIPAIVVNASNSTPGITYGTSRGGSFRCGGWTCTYNIAPYQLNFTSMPLRGVAFQLKSPGSPAGSQWVQTYTRDGGASMADCDSTCPYYPGTDTTSTYFYDQPGSYGSSGSFQAQTSLAQPNGAGGYSPIFTITWGYQMSGGVVTPIGPQVVSGP